MRTSYAALHTITHIDAYSIFGMLQVGCPSHRRFSVCHEHITIPGNQRAVPRKSLACVAHIVVDGTEIKSYQMKLAIRFRSG